MAYTSVYEADDIPAVVIDFIVKYGVVFIGFAALIGLVGVYRMLKGQPILPKL
jgi:hypothetical protein